MCGSEGKKETRKGRKCVREQGNTEEEMTKDVHGHENEVVGSVGGACSNGVLRGGQQRLSAERYVDAINKAHTHARRHVVRPDELECCAQVAQNTTTNKLVIAVSRHCILAPLPCL